MHSFLAILYAFFVCVDSSSLIYISTLDESVAWEHRVAIYANLWPHFLYYSKWSILQTVTVNSYRAQLVLLVHIFVHFWSPFSLSPISQASLTPSHSFLFRACFFLKSMPVNGDIFQTISSEKEPKSWPGSLFPERKHWNRFALSPSLSLSLG